MLRKWLLVVALALGLVSQTTTSVLASGPVTTYFVVEAKDGSGTLFQHTAYPPFFDDVRPLGPVLCPDSPQAVASHMAQSDDPVKAAQFSAQAVTDSREQPGNTWLVTAQVDVNVRLLFGTIDHKGGRARKEMPVAMSKGDVVTFRCRAFQDNAAASVQQSAPAAVQAAPPSAAPQGNCVLGRDLAARNGWSLTPDQAESVTKYGGAIVNGSVQVPSGWEAIRSGDGSRTSIYPPNDGRCRQNLGVAA